MIEPSSNIFIGDLEPNENRSVYVEIAVDRNALVGVYSIPYSVRYRDSTGVSYDQRGTFGVQIHGKPQLYIKESVSQNQTKIFPGAAFMQIFNVTNVGEDGLRKVQLSITVSYPFAITNSSSNFFVGDLNPKESQFVEVEFWVDQNAVVGVYSLPFTIWYEDFTGVSYDYSGAFGVQIVGKPKLLVDDIRVDPPSLIPGQEGLMTVRLTNVGEDAATDISIKIFGGSELLGGSLAYIANLDRAKTQSVFFPVNIASKLEPATYLLNITVTYMDNANKTYSMSKLYELEVVSTVPLFPYFYLALACGLGALAFVGYFFYIWKPKGLTESPMKTKGSDKSIHESRRKGRFRRRKILSVSCVGIMVFCIALIYVLLLIPYLVHANLDNAGVVVYSEEIALDSLPEGVQGLCKERGFVTPVVLLAKHLKPEWTTMVITSESFQVGTVVEMSDYVINWRVDWRDFNFVDQTFDRFAIASVQPVDPFFSSIEKMLLDQRGLILHELSRIDFNVGPVLIVFSLTILLQRRLALWNLPAIFGLYSIQSWRFNEIAYQHNGYVPPEWKFFSYFFIILIPLAFYAWHFERSEGGRVFAEKMKILSRALGLPGK
jgi:hypothetical protein